mmetsp:Transcript_75921/g.201695  ORF Transcript_75921/g.201695 Transcript_75921/m.201695 type:complete len:311 (-) Transcript_75921:34-966(-)
MCLPPLYEPTARVLGCLSLRQGAMAVLAANAAYGLSMVVVHALLLGEASRSSGEGGRPYAPHRLLSDGGRGGGGDRYAWLLQLLDLDLSWGHELLGFDEVRCLVGGLLYGILALVLCLGMLQMLHMSRASLAAASRFFSAFLATEVLLAVCLVYVKLQGMCKMQEKHWPALSMDCDALRFLYLQRNALALVAAALGTWVFASFSYALTSGNADVDKPEFVEGLEVHASACPLTAQAWVVASPPRSLHSSRRSPSRLPSYTPQRSLAPSVSSRSSATPSGRYAVLPPPSQRSPCVMAPQLGALPPVRAGGA